MRILYVGYCSRWINPTPGLLPTIMEHIGTVTKFGPGYVNSETLKGGIVRFLEHEGPFNIVVIGGDLLCTNPDEMKGVNFNRIRKHILFDFSEDDWRELGSIAQQLEDVDLPRIAILMHLDSYGMSTTMIERISKRSDISIAMGTDLFRRSNELPNLSKEAFSEAVTDKWATYAESNPQRIASTMHFASNEEVNHLALAHRKYTWSVMGVQYHARDQVRRILNQNAIKPLSDGWARKAISLYKKIIPGSREQNCFIDYLNSDFRSRLVAARYSYTCGSGLNIPIRKFFEIPAAGAVLACTPFSSFGDAGFVDQENAMVCEPEDIMEVHKWLESDLSRAQRIASAGRSMVIKNHSLKARAQQFKGIFEAVIDSTFAGARWEKGVFKIRHQSTGTVQSAK